MGEGCREAEGRVHSKEASLPDPGLEGGQEQLPLTSPFVLSAVRRDPRPQGAPKPSLAGLERDLLNHAAA